MNEKRQRCIEKLYTSPSTFLCAVHGQLDLQQAETTKEVIEGFDKRNRKRGRQHQHSSAPCVPCAYKIAAFDVALDTEFTRLIPNQRPESCPRASLLQKLSPKSDARQDSKVGKNDVSHFGYHKGMHILCVGDGDFSFSLALARALRSELDSTQRKTMTSAVTRIVATSYESLETLKSVYPSDILQETIKELQTLGVEIAYNVDATRLRETLPSDLYIEKGYHRVSWNFPCTAEPDGQDGQNSQMEQNKYLVRQFMAGASHLLHPSCGEIHMAHKTKPPFDQWKIECAATTFWTDSSSDGSVSFVGNWITEGVRSNALMYSGRVVFDRCCFPPYTPRKARHKKSFAYHDACIYIFSWKEKIHDLCPQDEDVSKTCFLPTIPRQTPDAETSEDLDSGELLLVTDEMITQIRSIHLTKQESKQRVTRRRNFS